jgi:hypothetical protein
MLLSTDGTNAGMAVWTVESVRVAFSPFVEVSAGGPCGLDDGVGAGSLDNVQGCTLYLEVTAVV